MLVNGTYKVVTFGCQMNKADSEAISGLLEQMGYAPSGRVENAEIIVVNSCAVREHAEHKAYSHLGHYLKLKRQQPGRVVVLAGCVAQKQGIQLLERFPYLDLVIGPRNLTGLPRYLDKLHSQGKRFVATDGEEALVSSTTPRVRKTATTGRGWVSIMVGCDRFCSYCIVPYTRERESCRSPEDIYQEVEQLVSRGCKEITLLGQSVTGYGKKQATLPDFAGLLKKLDQIPGDYWLRYTSPYPGDFDSRLVACYDRLEHLAPHLHLPVQSGSNSVLKRMNRKYSREDYLELIDQVDQLKADVALTTDVIVGFPGETEKDFEQTCELFEQVMFDKVHLFKFSPREGTPAATLSEQVPSEEIDRRHSRLLDLYEQLSRQKHQKKVGQTYSVLVQGESPKSTEKKPQFTGRTGQNDVVVFPRVEGVKPAEFCQVEIQRAESYTLFGRIVESEKGGKTDG